MISLNFGLYSCSLNNLKRKKNRKKKRRKKTFRCSFMIELDYFVIYRFKKLIIIKNSMENYSFVFPIEIVLFIPNNN